MGRVGFDVFGAGFVFYTYAGVEDFTGAVGLYIVAKRTFWAFPTSRRL